MSTLRLTSLTCVTKLDWGSADNVRLEVWQGADMLWNSTWYRIEAAGHARYPLLVLSIDSDVEIRLVEDNSTWFGKEYDIVGAVTVSVCGPAGRHYFSVDGVNYYYIDYGLLTVPEKPAAPRVVSSAGGTVTTQMPALPERGETLNLYSGESGATRLASGLAAFAQRTVTVEPGWTVFYCRAQNGCGESPLSDSVWFQWRPPPQLPAAPDVNGVGDRLTLQLPPLPQGAASLVLERQVDGGPWTAVTTNPAGPYAFEQSNLRPNIRYVFRCIAHGPGGSSAPGPEDAYSWQLPTARNTAPPAIAGTSKEGRELVCDPGLWEGIVDGYSYAWRYDGSVDGPPLATGRTYTPTGADVGRKLVCEVTATNAGGQSTARSAATGPVEPALSAPTNTTRPSIWGTPDVGAVLTCHPGGWLPDPKVVDTRYQFTWIRVPNPGESDVPPLSQEDLGPPQIPPTVTPTSVYSPTVDDFDHFIRCGVVARNAGGSSTKYEASVRVTSAGAGSRVLRLGAVSVVAPRRIALRATGSRVPLAAQASRAGVLKTTLNPRARARRPVASTVHRIRRAGVSRLVMRLPKRLAPGRYSLAASFKPAGSGPATHRVAEVTVVR